MHRIASGELRHVALVVRKAVDRRAEEPLRVFDDRTGRLIELYLGGTVSELMKRIETTDAGLTRREAAVPAPPRSGPGRPRLGVVAREVTLLPRHWKWLGAQPGGASAALRALVEDARRVDAGSNRKRGAQEAAYRFMTALAADARGFEQATRALFAADETRFEVHIADWPEDVREHAQWLAADAFKS